MFIQINVSKKKRKVILQVTDGNPGRRQLQVVYEMFYLTFSVPAPTKSKQFFLFVCFNFASQLSIIVLFFKGSVCSHCSSVSCSTIFCN